MALFKIENSTVKKITAKELDLEKNIQSLFENNMEELLGITFLEHEYSTSFGGRIDSLGIDKDGSPCILEYKKGQNENVINQGLSYLYWLLDHKAEYEKICSDKKINIGIDWDSPRVICIAESYNKFDLDAVNIFTISVELWRYRIYDENILYLEQENFQKIKVPLNNIIKKSKQDEDARYIQKKYSIEHHTDKSSDEIKTLFSILRENIILIDEEVKEDSKKLYLAYKINGTNFADIIFYKNELRITLNIKSGNIDDPQNKTTDFTNPKKGHWGNGDYEIKIDDKNDLDYIIFLIKQSYNLNK